MNPVLIGGDFNTVLCAQDRFQGNGVTEADIKDFGDCIQELDMHEVRAVGSEYTWCNNQEGEMRIYSNIDRCLANITWMSEYSSVLVERLGKNISDHCPQMLNFEQNPSSRKAPFRFLNVITDHEEFEGILKKEWETTIHSNKMLDIWFKCKRMKLQFKRINTQCFQKTSEKVNGIRERLKVTQRAVLDDKMNEQLIREEKYLLTELDKWSGIEERIWQQKSRIDWLKLGDANTKFYHAYVKARQNSNAIQLLMREDGTKCLNQEQIMEEIRDFYFKLMGSAATKLPMVDKNVVSRGAKLTYEQQIGLRGWMDTMFTFSKKLGM